MAKYPFHERVIDGRVYRRVVHGLSKKDAINRAEFFKRTHYARVLKDDTGYSVWEGPRKR